MIFDAGPPKWLTHSTQLWFVLLVGRSKKVHMLSFFRFMHFPLSGSPKRKGLFDCSVKIKNDLLQLFCGIPVKIGKMFINSYILSKFYRERRSFPWPLVISIIRVRIPLDLTLRTSFPDAKRLSYS